MKQDMTQGDMLGTQITWVIKNTPVNCVSLQKAAFIRKKTKNKSMYTGENVR